MCCTPGIRAPLCIGSAAHGAAEMEAYSVGNLFTKRAVCSSQQPCQARAPRPGAGGQKSRQRYGSRVVDLPESLCAVPQITEHPS